MDWTPHLSSDPAILHGQLCLHGTRIPVSLVLDHLAAGYDLDGIIAEYPSLTREAILAVVAYAADLARERILRIPA